MRLGKIKICHSEIITSVMPHSSKERQSVYQKALEICHEGDKELSLLQQDLERSKLQSYLSYKLEERQLRNELIRIKREQRSLAKEAKQRKRENKTIDDIAKEMKERNPGNRGKSAILFEKKFALPQINCTQKNVPQILKRKLSHESEYYTWTFGLPNIQNTMKSLPAEEGGHRRKEKVIDSKGVSDAEDICDNDLKTAGSNTGNRDIVLNIPASEPKKGKTRQQILPPINTTINAIKVASTNDADNGCNDSGSGPLGKSHNKKSNKVELPKL